MLVALQSGNPASPQVEVTDGMSDDVVSYTEEYTVVASHGNVVVKVTGAHVSQGVDTMVDVVNVLNVEVERINVAVPLLNPVVASTDVVSDGVGTSVTEVTSVGAAGVTVSVAHSGRPGAPQVEVVTSVVDVVSSVQGTEVTIVTGVHVSQDTVTMVVAVKLVDDSAEVMEEAVVASMDVWTVEHGGNPSTPQVAVAVSLVVLSTGSTVLEVISVGVVVASIVVESVAESVVVASVVMASEVVGT